MENGQKGTCDECGIYGTMCAEGNVTMLLAEGACLAVSGYTGRPVCDKCEDEKKESFSDGYRTARIEQGGLKMENSTPEQFKAFCQALSQTPDWKN